MFRYIEDKSQGMSFPTRAALVMLLTLPGALLLSGGFGPGAADAALPSTITTCDGCHGNPPVDNASRVGGTTGQFPGSHGMHQVSCATCHVAPGSTQFNHANGSVDMASPLNGATGAAYSKGSSFPVSNAAFSGGTCSGTNCHGAGTPTWGASTTKLECEKCHGSATTNPFYDTAGNTAKTAAHTGAHTAHLLETTAGKNIASNVSCATCHTVPAASNTAGHFDTYPGATVAITGALATKNSTLVPAYNLATGKCTNVYCHGAGLTGSGATDYSPTWNTPLLTGDTTATGDCSKCHQYLPPPQNGAAGSAHGGITAATQCKDCHTHVNAAGTGFDNPALHINGTVEGGTCVSCHSSVKNTYRRQVAGTGGDIDNGMASHHIKYTALSTNDCGICHDQTNHKTYSNGVSVYLKNLDGGASVLYDGTAANNGKVACLSCHDANGASSLGANSAKPFTASGDNTAPTDVAWPATGGAHDSSMVCFNCHGKSGAANTTLDPTYNGHGSPSAKLLHDANYVTATPNTYCYNCHDSASADVNKSTKNIKGQFALAYKHTTADCFDCHGDGTAANNVANLHKLKSGNHVNGTSIALNLSNATGKSATWSAASTWPSTSNATFTNVNPSTAEWHVCFKCHAGTGFQAGGTGAAAMTDLAMEFNTNNASRHPIGTALATANRLTAARLSGGWTPGSVMTCSDCHATDQSASKGPHGSSVKWMLAGANKAWPYTAASANGTSSGTYFRLATYNTGSGTSNGLFCFNCHPIRPASGGNSWHTNSDTTGGQHGSNNIMACVSCHIRVPHGGKVSRLLSTTNAPARYMGNGNGTAAGSGTYDSWGSSTTNIKGSSVSSSTFNSSCSKHGSATGGEAW